MKSKASKDNPRNKSFVPYKYDKTTYKQTQTYLNEIN